MSGISYTMATEIAINTVSAQQSIKGLDSALGSAVNSMKAGIAQASSVGDSLGAMQAKVSGLDQVMTQLQSKIDILKDRQSDLDVKTKEGAESYLKLQKQIEQSENRLASYSAQQDRAKESMTYYSSGLAELQRGYQTTIEKTDAYSNRLKAEGDELGANKAKLSGYKEALSNLTQQYEKQSTELKNNESKVKELSSTYSSAKSKLDEMASAGQKNSNEYKEQANKVNDLKLALNRANDALDTQKIRVDKTGTSAAETKSKISGLNNEIKEVNPTPFQRLKNKITEAGDAGHKSESIFKSVFTANLGANAVISLWTSLTSHIGEAIKAGMEYDKEQQKMVATWTTLTGHHKDALTMVDDVNKLSVATGQSAQQTDELEQKFYHLHSNKDEAHEMTKAMLNMADAVGLNGQQIDAVSQDMTNALSRGKASAGEINQITQYFPMYREQLAKSKNVTVQQLSEMVKQGKVSADDMEKVFEHLGNIKYGKAAENMLSTMTGAERTIKARMPQLIGDIEKPLMEAKNPMYLAVSKWASDPATDKEFKKMGKATSDGINTITAAFTKNFKPEDMAKGLNGVLDKMANTITNFSKTVANHSKDISNFFKTFKDTGAISFKLFANEASLLSKVLLPLLQFIADHQKVMVPLISGMMAMGQASKMLNLALMPIGITAKTISGPLKGVRSLLAGIGGSKVSKEAGLITKSFNLMGRGISKSFSLVAKGLIKGAEAFAFVGKAAGKMALAVIKAMGKMALAMATNPFGLIIIAITALTAGVVLAYNKIKPFRDAINDLGKMIVNVFKGVIDFFKNNWKQIGLFILNPFAGISAMLYKNVKPFRDFVNTVRDVIFKGFGAIGNFFGSFWNGVKNVFNTSLGFITKNWSSGWNSLKNIVTSIFGGISNFFGGVWNGIKNLFSSSLNFVAKIWSAEWNGISNVGKSIWNGITGFLGGFWNGIKSMFNSSLNFILNIWNNVWNTVANVGKGIWNGITNFLGGFWNGIKSVFNSSLIFISSVWNGTWNGIFSFGKGIWNGITNVFNGFTGGIKNIWNDVTSFVGRMWSGMWNGVINAAKSAVSTVGHVVAEIANGVIRPIDSMLGKLKDGINWILDKVGAHQIGGFHIPLVSYANGTKDTHQGGLAMVNDAPGSNFREMYQLPNGQVGMFPNKRNMIIPLPKGTSVLDGERSASMAKMMGLPAYKNGIGDFFGGLWNGAKDIFSDVENILKNPAKFMESTFSHFLGGFSSNIKLASSIITSFPKKLAAESINWIKKQFESMEAPDGSGSAPAGSGSARWRPYIVRAFEQLGVAPADWKVAKLLRQIQTESGGNPRIMQQIHDANSGGNESRGLLQFSGSTWAADALPGHTDWKNGYDEILAAIHVLEHGGEGGWGGVGNGHGWENGGFLNHHQMIEVGEHNMNEVVIPLDSSKRSRTTELMHQVLDMLFGNSDVNLDAKVNSKQDDKVAALINEVSELKDTVKDLVNLQIETIKAQNGTTNAVINTAQTPQDRYKQDAQNGQLLGYQQLNGGIA
ncbi:hypothetical protein AYR59_04675 [Fructilactobacillus lindneri]|uniref:Tape measure protein N-terminal domain-containing protein n=1 Tax=Fructilactobacillus lindneri TaxID=53444 RepID=A0AB33BRX1_9LACO|nr:tape measure protein [Fructilactobacillus lindneri]ANZ59348.1 hypothetical protein AYR59_04675 [Fructilactobacillus lindneri]